MITGLGGSAALVYFAGRRPGERRSLARVAIRMGTSTGLVAALGGVLLLLGPYRAQLSPELFPIALGLIMLAPVVQVAQFLESILQGVGKIVEISLADVGASAAMAVIGVAVLLTDISAPGWLIGIGAVHVLALLARVRLASSAGVLPAAHGSIEAQSVLKYGLKGYLGDLLQGANYRLDLFIIAWFMPLLDVGLYAVAVSFAELALLVPRTLSTILMQRAASRPTAVSAAVTSTVTRLTSVFLGAYGVAMALGGGWVLEILLGPSFSGSLSPLRLLLPGIWFLGLYENIVSDLTGRGLYGAKSIAAGLGAIVTVSLDVLLVPRYGIGGAAIASTIAYGVAFIAAVSFFQRRVGLGLFLVLVPHRGDFWMLRDLLKPGRKNQPANQEGPANEF